MTRAKALTSDDDDVALTGGVRVARMCAGLEPAAFLMHLGEATVVLRASLHEAGISHEMVHLAVEVFEAGAREEWLRIGGSAPAVRWGTA